MPTGDAGEDACPRGQGAQGRRRQPDQRHARLGEHGAVFARPLHRQDQHAGAGAGLLGTAALDGVAEALPPGDSRRPHPGAEAHKVGNHLAAAAVAAQHGHVESRRLHRRTSVRPSRCPIICGGSPLATERGTFPLCNR